MRFRLILFTCFLLLFSCENQNKEMLRAESSDLRAGEPTPTATLKKHLADTFRLNLESGAFVYGFADQKTVDVVVDIYAPDHKKLASFDNPARGPEHYQFITSAAGIHRIVLTPFKDGVGDYSLVLSKAEALAKEPEGRAAQIIAAAMGPQAFTPGVSVAVQKNGKVIYSKGFGYANLEDDIKNSPSTIFHIASVSKQFTAFAIAMLADQGKLSLKDDIRKYLPELHDFGSLITIDHLIHHTSGLRDQWNLLEIAGWRMDDVITQKQILRVISRQKELNFKPGEEMLYCNTGFTLLAEIVSRVTHESFADWAKKNMFDPLEMKNTFFYDDHEKIVKNRAYSYYEVPEGFKKSVLNYANAGATSLFTTVEDLSLWAINFEKVKVGNANVMKMMNQRFVLNKGDTISYAFGQDIGKYKGLNAFSHGGGDAGYRTYLLRFPDQHFSVAVFSNLASFNPGGLSYSLADLYLGKDFVVEKEKPKPPAAAEPEKKPFDPSGVKLSDFTGKYYSPELETSYTFDVVNDTLTAHHQRHDDLKLIPTKADGFETRILGNVEFTRNKAKQVVGLKLSNGRVRNLVFIRE